MNVPRVPDGPGPCLFVEKSRKHVRLIRWSIGAASAWGNTHKRHHTTGTNTVLYGSRRQAPHKSHHVEKHDLLAVLVLSCHVTALCVLKGDALGEWLTDFQVMATLCTN